MVELPITMVTAMVSPRARPNPKIIAPTMPELAAGNNTRVMVSQRVAPKPMEAVRNWGGRANNTSRLMAAIVGKIIIAKIKPATSILGPKGSELKRGNQGKVANRNCCKGNTRGIKTKIPHRPIITLGIEAINSTKKPMGVLIA